MPDRLSALLDRFPLRARVFHAGTACGVAADASPAEGLSQLHLLRRGRLACTGPDRTRQVWDEPTLLLLAGAAPHRLETPDPGGADLVCATVDFGASSGNPLLQGLPPLVALPLAGLPDLAATVELLFGEALAGRCGHHAAVDRLCELLVIQLLRHLMQHQVLDHGVMAGLGDPRLARAISALHADPARHWTLETLAQEAGMSRARFAARFAELVQTTPGDYLAGWRISVAKTLLQRGQPVKMVAAGVGYGSAAALSRAFSQRVGQAPAQWAAALPGRRHRPDQASMSAQMLRAQASA